MKYSEFLGKKYLIIIFVAVAIYSLFLFFSDFSIVYEKLQNFQITSLPLILLVVFSSWLVLFIRWMILLKKHQIQIPLKINFLIFFAGFTLAISPAKSGELIKSVLLKNKCGIAATKTIPIIFLERFYDIIGTTAVAIIGITFLGLELGIVLALVPIVILVIFYLFYSKRSFDFTLKILNHIKPLQKFLSNIEESHEIIRHSSDVKTICSCSGLTIVFRIIEAIGILLILQALGINFIEFFNLLSMYSASVILGSISMSPGGLGVTEGSFAGLLTLYELELQTTLAIAVIVRFFTMWFAIVVGFISLKLSEFITHNE
tara:strand:- start:1033 stop:1983 length:951 start_codon:yes stop_codon:yes gene_type:complete